MSDMLTIDRATAALWDMQGEKGVPTVRWTHAAIEDAVRKVNNGAQLLDSVRSGWVEEILPDKLNMANGTFCVIGQVYGDYDQVGVPFGMQAMQDEEDYDPVEECSPRAIEHGFLEDEGNEDLPDYVPYALLDRVWVYMLTERRRSGKRLTLELPPQEPRNIALQRLAGIDDPSAFVADEPIT